MSPLLPTVTSDLLIPGFAFSKATLTLSLSDGVKRLISFTGTFSTLFASTY